MSGEGAEPIIPGMKSIPNNAKSNRPAERRAAGTSSAPKPIRRITITQLRLAARADLPRFGQPKTA
jgi:hypothetical protein